MGSKELGRTCWALLAGGFPYQLWPELVAVRERQVHFVGSCMWALEGLTAAHLIRACGEVGLQIKMSLVKAPAHNKSIPEITIWLHSCL